MGTSLTSHVLYTYVERSPRPTSFHQPFADTSRKQKVRVILSTNSQRNMAGSKIALFALAAWSARTVFAQAPLAAGYNGYAYQGCYNDNAAFGGQRVLPNSGAVVGGPTANTIEVCINTCDIRYDWIGMENGGEVRCVFLIHVQSLISTVLVC